VFRLGRLRKEKAFGGGRIPTDDESPGPSPDSAFVGGVRRRTLAVATAAVASGLAWGQARTDVVRTIRLGQSLPLSGPHSVLGRSYRESAAARFEEANEQQRQTGLRFELISLDDQGQPELTLANARRLAASERVQALFGFVGEGADRVGAMAAEEADLPYVAPVSGAVELRTAKRPGVFVFRASHEDEIRYIMRHAELIGLSRLALAYELTFLGLEMRNAILDFQDPARRTAVALTVIDPAGSNFTVPGAVATILEKDPQAIILGSNDVASSALVRAVRVSGYKGYVYALSGVGSQGLVTRLGPLASGISVTQVVPFPLTDSLAVARTHRVFCARHGIQPTFHTMEAWIGASLFIEAVKRTGATQAAEIARSLTSAPEFDFGGYFARWYRSRPNPVARVSLTVYDRDGRLRA
jgi:branched-chain amino acid transport system substrate-binding protein